MQVVIRICLKHQLLNVFVEMQTSNHKEGEAE